MVKRLFFSFIVLLMPLSVFAFSDGDTIHVISRYCGATTVHTGSDDVYTYKQGAYYWSGISFVSNYNGQDVLYYAPNWGWYIGKMGVSDDWWTVSTATVKDFEGVYSGSGVCLPVLVTNYMPASSTPTNQSLNSINFGLAIIIVLLFLMGVGFMYNNITNKKSWLRF